MGKKKHLALLFVILGGSFGLQHIYLRNYKLAWVYILCHLITWKLVAVFCIIDVVRFMWMTKDEFSRKYKY